MHEYHGHKGALLTCGRDRHVKMWTVAGKYQPRIKKELPKPPLHRHDAARKGEGGELSAEEESARAASDQHPSTLPAHPKGESTKRKQKSWNLLPSFLSKEK